MEELQFGRWIPRASADGDIDLVILQLFPEDLSRYIRDGGMSPRIVASEMGDETREMGMGD